MIYLQIQINSETKYRVTGGNRLSELSSTILEGEQIPSETPSIFIYFILCNECFGLETNCNVQGECWEPGVFEMARTPRVMTVEK